MRALPSYFQSATALILAAIVAVATVEPVRAQNSEQSIACSAPAELTHFSFPLSRMAKRFASGKPITIIAIGSSSTAGAGASSPAASYPSRLAVELKERFPNRAITVLNRGVNGEEARDMLTRFETSVIPDKPDLVLWQLGTNSVLRDRPLTGASPLIQEGLRKLKAIGADVILIDSQYAPKVIAKHDVKTMVEIIATAAKQGHVNLFDRYAVMQHWREVKGIPFNAFLSADELHMNDWSYGCIAKLLAAAIAEAIMRPAMMATKSPPAR